MDVQSSRAKGKVHIGGDWKVGGARNGAGIGATIGAE